MKPPGMRCIDDRTANVRPLVLLAVPIYIATLWLCPPSVAISDSDPIDTNRPSFMFSPLVVPRGSLQFENGTLYQAFRHRHWTYDVPETQVRLGIAMRAELQASVPSAFLWHAGSMTNGKVSDLSEIGFKYHLGPDSDKFNASVIADITVPTGSTAVSGKGVRSAFRLPYGYNIKQWSIMGMQSFLILNEAKNLQYFPDVMLNRNIGTKSAAFIEYGGFFTQRTYPVNLIHFGAVYKVTPRQQVDVQFGFGMNRAAPVAFVGAGYSLRLDLLKAYRERSKPQQNKQENKQENKQNDSTSSKTEPPSNASGCSH
jgi:Putative MetA-pathway of phenol degradation